MDHRTERWWGSETLYRLLLLANALALAFTGWRSIGGTGVDQLSYIALAEGILHGHYSQWLQFDPPIPDTFRTPGYPLYLAVFVGLFDQWQLAMAVVQLAMYMASVFLVFRVMDHWNAGRTGRNVLLLLLLPSVNITAWIFVVTPEIPVLFCMAVLVYVDVVRKPRDSWSAIGIGVLLGFVFQCRPVYLLFPFARVAVAFWYERKSMPWRAHIITLVVFGGTLLPYAFWNKANHGVFSPTPVEGGGGVFNLGYWCGRIPGYSKERAFENFIADEMVRFVPEEALAIERRAYEREWNGIEAQVAPLLTERDSAMRAIIAGRPSICYSYNSRYAIARERLIKARTLADIREHPGYYAAFKAYTAVRLWVVGVDRGRFAQSGTLGKAGMIGAFLFTLGIFVGAIGLIMRAHRRGLLLLSDTWAPMLWVLYTGLIHVPFAIQTRYTSSVRMILYMLMAVAIARLWSAANGTHGTAAATRLGAR